ncbi:MAG: hydrolase [Anaerovoracaceae bacterium]|nr:hydrolase [Bacillota bacterium]MDY5771333.1 hydrolase [Anaerovoracaceae bacterium]
MDKRELTRIEGKLRSKYLEMPKEIYKAKGLVIMGRRIKSVIFTTDIAIIRSCNADAVLAVYPFTPQQIISQSIINVAPMPVFVGVGGGLTNGVRSAMIAKDSEGDGAWGVVVNAPMTNENIQLIAGVVDIPVIVTVIHENSDIQARLDAGASILNVSAAARTPEVVRKIREKFPKVPIIATGGPTSESILATIEAGADCISYTPPSTAEIFADIMKSYREEEDVSLPAEDQVTILDAMDNI